MHRLSGFGAVGTYQANGTSPEGFDGEWRMVLLLTVEGDRINYCEVYDESDLDAALARFEELQPQAPRLEKRRARSSSGTWRTSRPGTGPPPLSYWPTTLSRTIAVVS